jgi:hypothetical protein
MCFTLGHSTSATFTLTMDIVARRWHSNDCDFNAVDRLVQEGEVTLFLQKFNV